MNGFKWDAYIVEFSHSAVNIGQKRTLVVRTKLPRRRINYIILPSMYGKSNKTFPFTASAIDAQTTCGGDDFMGVVPSRASLHCTTWLNGPLLHMRMYRIFSILRETRRDFYERAMDSPAPSGVATDISRPSCMMAQNGQQQTQSKSLINPPSMPLLALTFPRVVTRA